MASKLAYVDVSSISVNADLALAGLEKLEPTILNSGIPEAALIFAATYKLVNGILDAGKQAEAELSTRSW